MLDDLAADVARVLAALLDEKAWFRRGLSDQRLREITDLPLARVVVARREAEAQGLIERQGVGTDHAVTMLTPVGVARARGMRPRSEEPDPGDGPTGEEPDRGDRPADEDPAD